MNSAKEAKAALKEYASEANAKFLQGYFKTKPGQYGAGDIFIGVRVPQVRSVAKKFKDLPLGQIQKLLDSKLHEDRMAGLIILTLQYSKANDKFRRSIYEMYIKNVFTGRINNWDLVDVSSPLLVGEYLVRRPRNILKELAKSDDFWQRRVAIISSYAFIKRGDPFTTLELAEILLHDEQDLIQKAVGWMLREVGKRCGRQVLLDFLGKHAYEMPRTMLRYSLEHLPPEQRIQYLNQKSYS